MRIFPLLLALLSLSLLTCTPKLGEGGVAVEPPPNEVTDVPDRVSPYGTRTVVEPGQTLRAKEQPTSAFTFLGVTQDNRCPTGTSCVQAGEATFTVRAGEQQKEITFGGSQRGTVKFNVPGGYAEVYSVDPYPTVGQKIAPEQYRLNVRLVEALQQ